MYLSAAALVLGVRYWVLPHIDRWRPAIAAELTRALGVRVRLGGVRAQWTGLDPSFELADVELDGADGASALRLPQLRARLSWRTFLDGIPRFVLLEARGMDLTIHRPDRQHVRLLGQSLSLDTASASMSSGELPGLAWLATQRQILFTNGTVRWIDESRGGTPLVLRHVTLAFINRGATHAFSLSAALPENLGSHFDLRGILTSGNMAGALSLQGLSGRLYARVDGVDTRGWAPWLTLPAGLALRQVDGRLWAEIDKGAFGHVSATMGLASAHWSGPPGAAVSAGPATLSVAGAWPTLRQVFHPAPVIPAVKGEPALLAPAAGYPPLDDVRFRASVKDLAVQSDSLLTRTLGFDSVTARGIVSRDENRALHVTLDRAGILNSDMDVALAGTWHQGGDGAAGIANAHGVFHRAALAAIERYLPRSVNEDAHDWMHASLLAGDIHDANFILTGDLDHFPFGERPDKGDFSVRGTYTGAVVDYVPTRGKRLGWPGLTDMSGEISLHRVDLRMVAGTASVTPVKGQPPIALSHLQAQIPNIEGTSILTVQGDTRGLAASYLGLMRHSPLGGLLEHVFDDARADGVWKVPLRLTIPLRHVADTRVRGAIEFGGGEVTPIAGSPPFTHVTGALLFAEDGATASGLKAQFMGGPATFSGGFSKHERRLTAVGTMQAKSLADYAGLEGMSRLTGRLAYRATLDRQKSGRYALTFDSDLKGLAASLPPPLGKTAEQTLPLQAVWGPYGQDMALRATLGKDVSLLLVRRKAPDSASLFGSGVVAVDAPVSAPPDRGLSVDVSYPAVNVDDWKRVYDAFSTPVPGAPAANWRVFPDLRRFHLASRHVRVAGADLDDVSFLLAPAQPNSPGDWRISLSSAQSAGTARWREASDTRAGSITADFQRLALGQGKGGKLDGGKGGKESGQSGTPKDDDSWTAHGRLDIPSISLRVNQFTLYGHPMGKLSLSGVNVTRGELWRLDSLHLSSPSFTLDGTGQWTLSGADRGLTLRAKASATNLGDYFEHVGFGHVMRNGEGTLGGHLQWRNLPWSYDKSNLNGQFDIALRKGSFSYEDSRTARLLKLLSLQSVGRLAKLEWNPATMLRNGFPYDDVLGTVSLDQGIFRTDNYRVVGPVGTIVLSGSANANSETLDLWALVVPNLDVSGAAIAAGIAINPVVGLGAFLAQWLLRAPLSKAMAAEYRIGGSWDDPVITEEALDKQASGTGARNAPAPAAKPQVK